MCAIETSRSELALCANIVKMGFMYAKGEREINGNLSGVKIMARTSSHPPKPLKHCEVKFRR